MVSWSKLLLSVSRCGMTWWQLQ